MRIFGYNVQMIINKKILMKNIYRIQALYNHNQNKPSDTDPAFYGIVTAFCERTEEHVELEKDAVTESWMIPTFLNLPDVVAEYCK